MSIQAALTKVDSIPRDEDGPIFSEPWQAQAFAMAVSLNQQGLFTWSEWVEQFSLEIADDGDPRAYYINWLTALEKLLNSKHIIDEKERLDRTDAWDRACRATPHGEPIVLGREKSTEK